jgi:hypothetical protein
LGCIGFSKRLRHTSVRHNQTAQNIDSVNGAVIRSQSSAHDLTARVQESILLELDNQAINNNHPLSPDRIRSCAKETTTGDERDQISRVVANKPIDSGLSGNTLGILFEVLEDSLFSFRYRFHIRPQLDLTNSEACSFAHLVARRASRRTACLLIRQIMKSTWERSLIEMPRV